MPLKVKEKEQTLKSDLGFIFVRFETGLGFGVRSCYEIATK